MIDNKNKLRVVIYLSNSMWTNYFEWKQISIQVQLIITYQIKYNSIVLNQNSIYYKTDCLSIRTV